MVKHQGGGSLLRRLPLLNLLNRPFRAAGLILLTTFLAFSLFGGSVLVFSLRQGLEGVTARLGADLIAVPPGCDANMESILLKGEPGYFYLDRSYLGRIARIEGVGQVSPQFYFTSTGSDCCDLPVQLIGFDPATDFSIQPWIRQNLHGDMQTGALLVGSDIRVETETSLTLFGKAYPVAARMEKTGTGLDNAVYCNTDTLLDLMAESAKKGFHFLDGVDPREMISSVLIKTADGYSAETTARNIRTAMDGVQVVKTRNMISGIADSLNSFSRLFHLLTGAVLLLSLEMLAAAYSITANERKNEFAILRMLGAPRSLLIRLLLRESLLVSAGGGIAGAGLSALIVFPFNVAISRQMGLPFLLPDPVNAMAILFVSLMVTLLSGSMAAALSVWRISRMDTSRILREGS